MEYYERKSPKPNLTEVFSRIDGNELVADIYLPGEKIQNGAAVLFVHGGGWRGGSREQFLWHAHRLALHGYVTCSIDYRLTQVAIYPAALDDCQSAVRWLRRNAERFNFDANKIGAMGSSSGGHLSTCLGVFEKEVEGVSSKVNGVVDVCGIHDFISLAESVGTPNEARKEFLGGSLEEKPENWKQASPALYVDGKTAPMMIIHDPEDEIVPYDQAIILANAMVKNARPIEFMPTPGAGHGYVYNPQDEWTQKVWQKVVSWLDTQLLGNISSELIDEIKSLG